MYGTSRPAQTCDTPQTYHPVDTQGYNGGMLVTTFLLVQLATSRPAPLAVRFSTLFPIAGTVRSSSPPRIVTRDRLIEAPRTLAEDRPELICGLTVVRKSAEIDPRILLQPYGGEGIAVRRIEPNAACASASRR